MAALCALLTMCAGQGGIGCSGRPLSWIVSWCKVNMDQVSTSKAQFLADLERLRRLPRQLMLARVFVVLGLLFSVAVAVLVHPALFLLWGVSIVFLRVTTMRYDCAVCPRCEHLFFFGVDEEGRYRTTFADDKDMRYATCGLRA